MHLYKRKELERRNLLKYHKRLIKRNVENFNALNITNIDTHCEEKVIASDRDLQIISMKEKLKDIKVITDRYNLEDLYRPEYASISYYYNMMKNIPLFVALNLITNFTETRLTTSRKRHKLISEDRLKSIKHLKKLIEHTNLKLNLLLKKNYSLVKYIKEHLMDFQNKECRINKSDSNIDLGQLKKFMRVCEFMPPNFDIRFQESADWEVYLCFNNLFKHCCNIDLKDSEIIVALIKIIIKMHANAYESPMFIFSEICDTMQSSYPPNFFNYILDHIRKIDFDIQDYISKYPNTAWDFVSNFSVLEAFASGNEAKVKSLMQHGFDIFPEYEKRKLDARVLNVPGFPETHRFILEAMRRIKLKSSNPDNNDIILTAEQKKCFTFLWSDIPDFFVNRYELRESLKQEYNYLLSLNIPENECLDRYEENEKLRLMYINNFNEIATSEKPSKNVFHYMLKLPYG